MVIYSKRVFSEFSLIGTHFFLAVHKCSPLSRGSNEAPSGPRLAGLVNNYRRLSKTPLQMLAHGQWPRQSQVSSPPSMVSGYVPRLECSSAPGEAA